MPAQNKTLYGIISVLIALIVITSTLAAYYYTEYNQASTNYNRTASELQSASSKYSSLADRYNALLSTYNGSVASFEQLASIYNSTTSSFNSLSNAANSSFTLLVNALSELNTSDSAYVSASQMLNSIWKEYSTTNSQYKELTSSFQTLLTGFESKNNVTLNENLQPISLSLLNSNLLIDFGNGTARWFNESMIEPQWNVYVGTLLIAGGNVNATYYSQYGEHFVTGIDGIQNSDANNKYWFLWSYNSTSSWQVAQVGPDMLPLYNGSTYAWTYCGADINFNPTCTP